MGLFGKKKGLVGVDIGSSAVKAVELKVGGKGNDEYQLLNIGIESLPPEAIVDGAIMDASLVVDTVNRHGGFVNKFEGDAIMAEALN